MSCSSLSTGTDLTTAHLLEILPGSGSFPGLGQCAWQANREDSVRANPQKDSAAVTGRVSNTWEDEWLGARGENGKTEDKEKPQGLPRNIPTSGKYT